MYFGVTFGLKIYKLNRNCNLKSNSKLKVHFWFKTLLYQRICDFGESILTVLNDIKNLWIQVAQFISFSCIFSINVTELAHQPLKPVR